MQVLNTDYSALVAASCMNRLAKLSARFIGNRGFSIGIDDVTPAPRLVEKKQQTVSTGYAKVQEYIKDFSKGRLKLESGCDSEQSLEKVVTDALNDVREKAAKVGFHLGCQALCVAVTYCKVTEHMYMPDLAICICLLDSVYSLHGFQQNVDKPL